MLSKDYLGKQLSSSFYSAIDSYAQKVKPKVLITFLDSRHVDNLSISTNDSYSNTSRGTLSNRLAGTTAQPGYFFTPEQSMNGFENQAYTWACAGDKDNNGHTITANGNWYAMPSDIDDNYEYGWRSNSTSLTTGYTDGGFAFATPLYLEYSFTQRKVNKIKISTAQFSGKIKAYRLDVYNNSLSSFYNTYASIGDNEYFNIHSIPENLSNDVDKIKITIYSTKSKQDHARINEVSPIYEVDVTDYIITHNVERNGELWESSIPIAGSASSSATINLDNTTGIFNPFDSSSLYGKYMKKDIKINIYNGWRVVKTNSILVSTKLKNSIDISDMSIIVDDASEFLDGGASNLFTLKIAPGTANEEIVLCSSRTDKSVTIEERGFAGTTASNHAAGVSVVFDPYEYVNAGEFYVDTWSGNSGMTVSATCLDKTKFLTEKRYTKGFYVQNSTIGDAVEQILMQTNISKSELSQIQPYSLFAKKNAIASYSFSVPLKRDDEALTSGQGLRFRIWKISDNVRNQVKDIKADSLDIILSDYDKAMGVKPYINPTFTSYSNTTATPVNSNTNLVVDMQNFSFPNGTVTESQYYNGVIDGYYIPSNSGDQDILFTIKNGGVRVFLDDTYIINDWSNSSTIGDSRTASSQSYLGRYLNLDAGVPYKIRIEFFHGNGMKDSSGAFELKMYKKLSGGSNVQIPISDCSTVIAEDLIGSRLTTFTKALKNRNHYRNHGVYSGTIDFEQTTGIVSEPKNKSIYLHQNAYVTIPYDESLNLVNSNSSLYTGNTSGEFTIECYVKFPNGAFTSDGTYISNETTVESNNFGYSFFYNNSGHGYTLHTPSGNETVYTTTGIDSNKWDHICVTYKDSKLKYYHDGQLVDTNTSVSLLTFGLGDLKIGSTSKGFFIDEFAIYNKALDAETIENRWIATQIKEINTFPHLYGNDQSAKEIIDAIALADFGRMYVDEKNKFRYDHFNRYFETSIPQHSNIQKSISGNTHIVSGDYSVELQANKVTVKVTSQNAMTTSKIQNLWTASPDPSTLGVVKLKQNINSTANTVPVTTTDKPPFPRSGYIKIGEEVMKYSSIDSTNFLSVERGQFDTEATDHYANDLVREAKYYDIKYSNTPAFNIQRPFITGVLYEKPATIELLKFSSNAYGAELLLAASSSVAEGGLAFIQGVNPLSTLSSATSLVGTPIISQESSDLIQEQSATLSSDIKKYGLKEIVIDNQYIYDSSKAKQLAEFIISKFKEPVPILNIVTMAIPTLQIGDKIRITSLSSLNIQDVDYWVVSHSLNVGDTLDHNITLRKVI